MVQSFSKSETPRTQLCIANLHMEYAGEPNGRLYVHCVDFTAQIIMILGSLDIMHQTQDIKDLKVTLGSSLDFWRQAMKEQFGDKPFPDDLTRVINAFFGDSGIPAEVKKNA